MPKEISLRFELFSLNRVKSPMPHRQVDITDKVVKTGRQHMPALFLVFK